MRQIARRDSDRRVAAGGLLLIDCDTPAHEQAVVSLQEKYAQYETHDLTERPVIRLDPGSVVSWGRLDR